MTRPVETLVVLSFALVSCAPQQVTKPEPVCDDSRPASSEAAGPARQVIEIQGPAGQGGETVTLGRYETRSLDPVIEELRQKDKDFKSEQGEATSKIQGVQKDKKEKDRAEKLVLKASLPEDQRPGSLEQFNQIGHIPPVAQYYTGTCWAFAMTSFMESEVERKTGKQVKLSEMATVYHEYQAKAGRWVDERGGSLVAEGSETNALTRIWKAHGAWPEASYAGVTSEDQRHDHQRLTREIEAVLDSMKGNGIWDKETVLSMVKVIQDRDMGAPPETFEFEGKSYTGQQFMTEVLTVDPDEYVEFMSTLKFPFWTQGEFEVPDNWWHDDSYHNVPLDDFYAAFKGAVEAGYTVTIAVDVSEPGKDAENDTFFVPSFDIPGGSIDQLAREYRFVHKVTTDDHALHVVGYTEHAGRDWFLIKDSGRSARHGKHEGYYFMRGDYVRLKVLAYTVHRDAMADLLAKFPTS